ncbi:uncharacterized protein LOC134825178 isoform X2 [Bolinopsis microptera]|uniref:uncharacterized protein LOC134825178 isoform X2 n=1 Tax=Bolinopsis microptera TaxID=2820187 RepID=UPI0030794E2B
MNPNVPPQYSHYQVGVPLHGEEIAQCSKDQIPQQMFPNHKGPMKVCLKRPDGSMVEQTHLSVSHTKDGKFVINANGNPQGSQWLQGNGQQIRAILIDNKQGGGLPSTVQLPSGARIVSSNSSPHPAPAGNVRIQQHQVRQSTSPGAASGQRIVPKGRGQMNHTQQRPTMSRQVSASKSSKQHGGHATMQPARPPTMRPTHPNSTQSSVRHMQPAAQPAQHYNQEMIQPPPAPGPRSGYTPQQMHSAPGSSSDHQDASEYNKQQRSVPQYKGGQTPSTQFKREPTTSTQYKSGQTPSAQYKSGQTPSTPQIQNNTPSRQAPSTTPARWSNNSVINGISSMSNGTASGSRKRVSPVQFDAKPTPTTTTDRKRPRRSSERGGKGLRHFSSKVCEKVKSKGVTTYLEVSEELVEEFSHHSIVNSTPSSANSFDVKNIRRRVYDALNVLCAMNIISKDKKEIRWIGLPTNSLQECRQLEKYKQEIQQRIKEKKKKAQEFMLQLIAYRTLIQRNREMEEKTGPLPENATIQVPFLVLSTGPDTQIGLEVADDRTEYEFRFNEFFEIHDEIGILKKMGFCYGIDTGEFTPEGLAKAESLLPKSAKPFLKELFPRKSETVDEEQKPLEIVEHPQQISVKYEPQELTEVQKQALETYSFDAPTYSSGYPSYKGQHSVVNSNPEQAPLHSSSFNSAQVHGVAAHLQHGTTSVHVQHSASTAHVQHATSTTHVQHATSTTHVQHATSTTHVLNVADKSRDTAAANTLLSLTTVNQ